MASTDASKLLEGTHYKSGELALVCGMLGCDEVIPDCLALERATSLEERKRAAELVLRKINEIASRQTGTMVALLQHALRDPLEQHMQSLGMECRVTMPKERVPCDEVEQILSETLYAAILRKTGKPHERVNNLRHFPDEVMTVVKCLVKSEGERHDTHGVIRLLRYVQAIESGEINPQGKIEFTHEEPGFAQFDAHWTFGQVGAEMAIQYALQHMNGRKRRSMVVAGRNLNHASRVAWMLQQAVEGYAALGFFNTEKDWYRAGPEPNGMEWRWGTNPIAFGIPLGNGKGIVGDSATTNVSEGWVKVAHTNSLLLPHDVLRTADGTSTTDPAPLYERDSSSPALLYPLGGRVAGYKGAMQGLMTHLLVHAMSGRKLGDVVHPAGNNVLLILLRVDDDVYPLMEALLEEVRQCPTTEGVVRIPGEHGAASWEHAKEHGLEIATGTWEAVMEQHRKYCGKA